MSYSMADGRTQVLSELARATELIGAALTELGEAYELLDERSADRLEEELFGPVQRAYARAQGTHSEFSRTHDITPERFTAPAHGAGRPGDVRATLERVRADLEGADSVIAELQDSMLPVEVGNPPLRAGLAAVREQIAPLPVSIRELLRVLGR